MMPTSLSTFQYSVALDVGTAWTRAANLRGARFSVESQRDRPQNGTSAGTAVAPEVIGGLLKALRPHFFWRPRVVAAFSSCATTQEQTLFKHTLYRSGAGEVTLVPQSFAAAVGAGLDPSCEHAQMIVDVGEGFTEYALIRCGRVEHSESLTMGCGVLREALSRYGRQRGGALLHWLGRHSTVEAARRGMIAPDLASEIRSRMVAIADGAQRFFHRLPDRLACEVIESGITLVGGGALLYDLRSEMALRTRVSVHVPAKPLTSVIEGVAKVIPYATMMERR